MIPAIPRAVLGPTAAYYGALVALGMVLASLGSTIPGLAAQMSTSLSGIPIASRFGPGSIFATDAIGCSAAAGLLLLLPDWGATSSSAR